MIFDYFDAITFALASYLLT